MRTLVKGIVLTTILMSTELLSATKLETEQAERLRGLLDLDMAGLGEVDVKLDDVFDVFDGLVKQEKVKVASGREQSAAVAPSVTSVITAQDIEATGARNLAEVLRMVPGLAVGSASSWRSLYVMRGMFNSTNPEVLFLLNGMPLKHPESGNLGMFPVEPMVQNIARIEIIRGPGSAVFGADAFSGVINIITKSAQDIAGTEVGTRIGSYDTYEGWVLHGSRQGELDIATSIQIAHTDGLDATIVADQQTLLDNALIGAVPNYQPVSNAPGPLNIGEKSVDAHLDLGWRQWQLRLNYKANIDQEPGLFVLNLDPLGQADVYRYHADLIWHEPHLAQVWDVQARFNYQYWDTKNRIWYNPPGVLLPGQGVFPDGVYVENIQHGERLSVGTDIFYRGFGRHVPRFGFGVVDIQSTQDSFQRNQGLDATGQPIPAGSPLVDLTGSPASNVTQRERSRDNWHVFVQDSWAFYPGWEFTVGLRYDDYSDFGSTTNPRAALVWQTTPRLTSKLLYGEAFRAPTLQEMYLNNPLLRGNPNLKPETVKFYELAFDWRATQTLYLTWSVYRFDVEDKILPITGILEPQYLNSGQREGLGTEFELRWKLNPRTSLLFNYAYAENTVKPGQNDDGIVGEFSEGNYPRHTSYLRLDWMFQPNWYINSQFYWAGDYARPPEDNRPTMSDNTSVDLTLRYKKVRNWDWNLAVGVRNLFDSDIRDPSGSFIIPGDLPLGGRNGFAELRYQF